MPYTGLDALVWNRNDGDKIDGTFAGPLRRSVGDPRDGQTVPDSYRMSSEHVLHEKSIATTAIKLRVRRAPSSARRQRGDQSNMLKCSQLCSRQ